MPEKKHPLRLIVTAAGGAMWGMTQNGPDEAEINFCKWPRKIFTSWPEACLQGFPIEGIWVISAMLMASGIIWFLWPRLKRDNIPRMTLIGLGIAWVAMTVVFATALLQHYTDSAGPQQGEKPSSPNPVAKQPVTPPQISTQPALKKGVLSARAYTQKDKENLIDMMVKLTRVMQTVGGPARQSVLAVNEAWQSQLLAFGRDQKIPDMKMVSTKLDTARKEVREFQTKIFDIRSDYPDYFAELGALTAQLPDKDVFTGLQWQSELFQNAINTVENAYSKQDRKFTESVFALADPSLNSYMAAENDFNNWINTVNDRIKIQQAAFNQ
jgi:hypothetical protein